ncbi:MAG: hypothetical protein HW376_1067 [candidate division NC10 bacterium]|nr:hypothetical protein [candidate division NC10 bacterium]
MVKNNYATRQDLVATKESLEVTIENFKKEIKTAILESDEKVLGELQDMREEFSTHQFSHMRINDEIQEHDSRLKKLETAKI